jgi:hypothetical protein
MINPHLCSVFFWCYWYDLEQYFPGTLKDVIQSHQAMMSNLKHFLENKIEFGYFSMNFIFSDCLIQSCKFFIYQRRVTLVHLNFQIIYVT